MKNHFLTKEAWVFLILTVICVGVLFAFVNLVPHVDYDVFFSSEDPNYKADIEISRLFPRNDTQIIISISGDPRVDDYQKKIKRFGDLLMNLDHIKDVKSIMHGPKNVRYALESPLWQRMLISDHQRSSNVIIMLDPTTTLGELPGLIPKIENMEKNFESKDFQIRMSGFPYIVELIRRHLNTDLRIFSSLAFLVFGFVVVMIFQSPRILLGMVIACFNAAALTLMCTHFLNIKIGILTANLTTIVFVLTLSHIIFLTFNWRQFCNIDNRHKATSEAIKITLPASFWAMVTTLLGFVSLLYVQAQPIKELGTSGAIGTVIAFLMAYCVYPTFLRIRKPSYERSNLKIKHIYQHVFIFFEKCRWFIIVTIIGIILLTLPELRSLNMDPSLISFFSKDSKITEGLKYIDKHGGSNPLIIVVKDKSGESLDTKENVQRLWQLHKDLENHTDVGTVISLPLLVSEARRSSIFSFLFSNRSLLNMMDTPKYGQISKGFVTEDRQNALFLLRMNEEGRRSTRLEVIDELEKIIENHGFTPYLIGGIYALQGHLSQHVATSLIYGLGRLILIFMVIALIISHSFRTALGMTFSICLIPLCILGSIATLRIPLDIITAPATNIAIAIGIDAMIHMVHTYRRLKNKGIKGTQTWIAVRKTLWEPIVSSMFIISFGFGIFFFSSFPPTQRFGGSIVFGTIIATLSALFIFPLLAKKEKVRRPPKSSTKETNHITRLQTLTMKEIQIKNRRDPTMN